jgi:preprotein translocase SecE subunit
MTYPATKRKGRFKIFGEVIAELKKVVWGKPREWVYLTLLTLIIATIAGLSLGGLDIGFAHFAGRFFIGK